MRLAQIADRTINALDLTRAEAREEARAGHLWASSRFDVAIAPNEAAARWALEAEQVERVTCSTLPERLLAYLGERAFDRTMRRRERAGLLQRLANAGYEPVRVFQRNVTTDPRLEIPLGESAWQHNENGLGSSAVGAPLSWQQGTSAHDGVHPSWPSTLPLQWERIMESYEADE